jgi:hypothetical protein
MFALIASLSASEILIWGVEVAAADSVSNQ